MSKRQQQLRHLLQKTVLDFLKDEADNERKEVFEQLMEYRQETGAKSFTVMLPDGEAVATYTIVEPKPKDQIDDDELVQWLENNGYSHLVKSEWVPGYERKQPAAGALKEVAEHVSSDGDYITADGEVIGGVKQLPAAPPKNFMVKYADGNNSRQRIVDAWQNGELGELDLRGALPELAAANEEQEHNDNDE